MLVKRAPRAAVITAKYCVRAYHLVLASVHLIRDAERHNLGTTFGTLVENNRLNEHALLPFATLRAANG